MSRTETNVRKLTSLGCEWVPHGEATKTTKNTKGLSAAVCVETCDSNCSCDEKVTQNSSRETRPQEVIRLINDKLNRRNYAH